MSYLHSSCVLLLLVLSVPYSLQIRCFECRSDIQLNCGDPFYPGNIPAIECSNVNNNPTFMCYKAAQYLNGGYVTVRGCAPFNSDNFLQGMQRAMAGTYWKGFNHFSMCDYDQCNHSVLRTPSIFLLVSSIFFGVFHLN